MEWTELDSNHLQAAAYDPEEGVLFVQFKNGRRYGYEGVPEQTANQLFQATDSHGKFFRAAILKYYQGQEITDE